MSYMMRSDYEMSSRDGSDDYAHRREKIHTRVISEGEDSENRFDSDCSNQYTHPPTQSTTESDNVTKAEKRIFESRYDRSQYLEENIMQ